MEFRNIIEKNDTKEIIQSEFINWKYFQDKTVLVTGATGLIGSQIIKALLFANEEFQTNIRIIGIARNKSKVKSVFQFNRGSHKIEFIYQDITKKLNHRKKVDYIIHTANSTSSASFVEAPVETIDSIVQGTKNILDFAKAKSVKSIVYLSSMEVYGNISTDRAEPLTENDYGYIDILKARSSYPEGKRIAECLCSAYAKEYNIPVKIARLAQTIGAGVDYNDKRVFAQFARNIVEKEDIILKTKGETIRSYCYITDAVIAILSMLEKGDNGDSYNIANPDTTCSIKEMAEMLCKKYPTSKLIINIEDRYYPDTTKYFLDTTKYYNKSGWKSIVDLETAYSRLIDSFIYSVILPEERNRFQAFLRSVFSLVNCNTQYKQLCILGIKFKIKRNFPYQKYKNTPIQNNKIVFSNFDGKGYGCNPKYIAEEILNRNLPYDLYWIVNDTKLQEHFPSPIKLVKSYTKEAYKTLATAKIWIDNQRKVNYIKRGLEKKSEQIYIQTWHGSIGIKRLDNDVIAFNNSLNQDWIKNAKYDSKMSNYLLSNSKFETTTVCPALWFNNNILEIGHPRNDIFFKDEYTKQKLIAKVHHTLRISPNKKILLYMPSFRDNYSVSCYNINFINLKNAITNRFGGEWIFAVRFHPRMSDFANNLYKYSKDIINVSQYPDIQELLLASEIAISDYSSCMFDYILTQKPLFVFATDIEKYRKERGFYYPLESTPFPIAQNNEELCQNIINFNLEKYRNEVELFLKEKGCIEDGHASERVVNLIEEIMRETTH